MRNFIPNVAFFFGGIALLKESSTELETATNALQQARDDLEFDKSVIRIKEAQITVLKASSELKCKNCGYMNVEETVFCRQCGTKLGE